MYALQGLVSPRAREGLFEHPLQSVKKYEGLCVCVGGSFDLLPPLPALVSNEYSLL